MSKYSVKLNQEQRKMLEEIIKKGEAPARKILHANILLKTDSGEQGPRWSMEKIEEAFTVHQSTIKQTRKRFVENGLEDALNRRPQPERPGKKKIQGEQEAHLIAMLCTQKPEGQEKWTLRAIADRLVELEIVETVSHETVRTVLKKNELKPWQEKQWCIGETGDGNYVYHMEDVLDVYMQPYNEKEPVVCFDEGSVQFIKEEIPALEMEVGKVKKVDYHYKRDGFCSIFLACEPLSGKRMVEVKERRTKLDFADFMKRIVDEMYPEAEKVVLVMDNLSSHSLGALYHVFAAEEAKRIWKKIEIHWTPRHGSWLNMAEIELSVLGRQVFHERLGDRKGVQEKVAAWEAKRNRQEAKIDWRFIAEDARIKLKRLYPIIKEDESDTQKAK